MPRPQMSLDMMLYEDPRDMQSVMVSPAEEALLRARDVELRDRPVEGNIASPVDIVSGGMAPRTRIPFRLPGERAMSPAGTALAESMAPKATASVATVPGRKAINDMADQELEGLLRTLERKSAGPMDPAPPDPLRDMPELAAYRAKADKMPMYDAPPVEMRVGAPGGPAPEEPDLVRMAEVRSLMRRRMLAKEREGTVPDQPRSGSTDPMRGKKGR